MQTTAAKPSLKVVLPRPYRHQVEELNDTSRFKVSVHGRRWGKSLMGLVAAVDGHGTAENRQIGAMQGANVWWVAPNYKISEIIWRLLKRACRNAWIEKKEVERRILLPSSPPGGSITVKSAEDPDSLRGDGLHGVIMDEAAYSQETTWTHAVRPALSDKEGWAWFISTPNGGNWFRRLFQNASGPGWKRWQGPTTTMTVRQAEMDAIRREIGSRIFRQEYLAEFLDMEGDFFKRDYFRYYQNGGDVYTVGGQAYERSSFRIFSTMDLAASLKTSGDYTVVSTFGITPKKDLLVLDVQRARMEGPDQVPMLHRTMERFKPSFIGIESTGFQLSLVQAARRAGLPVKELKRDKDKVSRACILQARMEGGGVFLPEFAPWLKDLEEELLAFPNGEHDDQVDTMSDGAAIVAQQLFTPSIRSLS